MAHRAEGLVRLPADVTAGTATPATPLREALGGATASYAALVLEDRTLAKAIQREIREAAPALAERVLPRVRRTPVKWFPYGRKGVRASVESVYLLAPPREPSGWVASGSVGREATWIGNGNEEIAYAAISVFFWDRDQHDEHRLMSSVLAQDLGARCAAEALALAERTGPAVNFLGTRAECREPAGGWLNMRATDAFCDEFKRVIEAARKTPGHLPGVLIPEALIDVPWAWR